VSLGGEGSRGERGSSRAGESVVVFTGLRGVVLMWRVLIGGKIKGGSGRFYRVSRINPGKNGEWLICNEWGWGGKRDRKEASKIIQW